MFFTFHNAFGQAFLFFVRARAVHTAESGFFSVDDFSVAALVNFAAAVSTHVEAGFDGDGNQVGEAFEKPCAQFSAFFGEFEDFFFFLSHGFDRVFDQAFFFELLKKRVDKAGADLFSHSLFEAVEDAVAVGWSFV